MKEKYFKFIKIVSYIMLFVLSLLLFNNFYQSFYKVCQVGVDIDGNNMGSRPIEVYYAINAGDLYNSENVVGMDSGGREHFVYQGNISLPIESANNFKLDIGSGYNAIVTIKNVEYRDYNGSCSFSPKEIESMNMHDIEIVSVDDSSITLKTVASNPNTEPDPYIDFVGYTLTPHKDFSLLYSIISAIIFVFLFHKFVRLKAVYSLFADLFSSRKIIFSLAKNDFKTKYSGSYFGIIWSFIQPVCTILVFWFVFQVGFRSNDIGNIPYILWFASGLIPWFFFSEAWNSATNSFIEYSYLVKKVVFKIHILPLVKIISNLFVHLFFIVFLILFFLLYGIRANILWLQIVYYSFAMIMLVISLSYITSTLVIFFKDLGQIMNIVLQFGMWLTPIMWQIDIIPESFMWLFKLNPMYYIVQGYRDSMIYNIPFYNNIKQTLYFWIIVLLFMLIGSLLYKKLKPHFADVL